MIFSWPRQVITWINMDLSSNRLCGIHLGAISQEVLLNFIRNMCSEITLLNSPIVGLVQDCSICINCIDCIANALEILQSYTKPSEYVSRGQWVQWGCSCLPWYQPWKTVYKTQNNFNKLLVWDYIDTFYDRNIEKLKYVKLSWFEWRTTVVILTRWFGC